MSAGGAELRLRGAEGLAAGIAGRAEEGEAVVAEFYSEAAGDAVATSPTSNAQEANPRPSLRDKLGVPGGEGC